jgi:enamine deaminase RidA (YjgF/YER057c/UK114 family)
MDILKELIKAFILGLKSQKTTVSKIETVVKKELLTVNDVITSSGKYPDRANSPELTDQVKDNIKELLKRVNPLLEEIGYTNPILTSGFRTSKVNSNIANAAKKSNHMIGAAVDVLDNKDQSLCKIINNELLIKYNLYREDSDYTKGNSNWCHLQTTSTKSGNRIFIP